METLLIDVNNTGPEVRKLEICTFPRGELQSELYLLTCDNGATLVGIPSEVHPTHRDFDIVGTWPTGRYSMVGTPIPGIRPVSAMFEYHPALLSEPTAIIPRARVGTRQIEFTYPPEQRTNATGQWIIWRGKTTSGPLVSSTVHMRIGHLSALASIVAWAKYSDRLSPDWTLEEEFFMEFDEPVSWHTQPYAQRMNSETRVCMRGTMLFTLGEDGDNALNGRNFLPGAISVRANKVHRERRTLLFSNIHANENMPTREPIAQSAFTSGTGGRRAFGVQDLTMLIADPDVIHRTLLANDIDSERPYHYNNTDGSPLGLLPENEQYDGAFYNSRLDYRLGSHDNFSKPRTWAPEFEASAQDYGHMSIHIKAMLWVMTSDPLVLEDLEDQAIALIYASPRFGSRNDRYVGQPLCALALLAKVLGSSHDFYGRIVAKITRELALASEFRSRYPGYELPVWPGERFLYGRNVPNPNRSASGQPIGWAPWQISRYVQGVIDTYAWNEHIVPQQVIEDAVKMAECVILEGVSIRDGVFRSYYAVTYADGQRINAKDDLHEDGRAGGVSAVNAGYLWTHAPSVYAVLKWSKNGVAIHKAMTMLSIMRAVVRDHEQASWMSYFDNA